MQAEYSKWIVAASYVIAVIASYVALDMASRVAANRGTKVARYWLIGGAIAMGAGIWSMHFVGMLAFSLPIPLPYNPWITLLSLIAAVAASGVALYTISRGTLTTRRLLIAGVIMGAGVGLMHYTGMFALKVRPMPSYDPLLFSVSILIAIAASIAAMWICFQLKSDTIATAFWKKSASALVMGIAIWGMHFTGMAAAIFDPNTVCGATVQTLDNKWLATTVGLCTFFFLSATLLISLVDAKMSEHRTTLEAQAERFFNQSPNLICLCGADGHFQRLNPAGLQTLGFGRDALLTMSFHDIIVAEDRSFMEAALKQLVAEKSAMSLEARCGCVDGSSKAMLWNITLSHDGVGFYATGQDITERKRAEAELARTYQRLLEVSRQAGMAEVATGVLHNVGNVLNSVNISADLVGNAAQGLRTDHLKRMSNLLAEHKATLGDFITLHPQGKLVPEYLAALAEGFGHDRGVMLTELDNLRKSIDHIKNIVAMQQNFAKGSGVAETLPLTELVELALRINSDSLQRHDIDLVRDFQVLSDVTLDKHKVMQVVINLVRNAKKACDESGRPGKSITVRTTSTDSHFQIAVVDNGVGIPAENLTKIFSHGFTTRKDGHGFGLHSGALAARELGGTLRVTSDGPGHGATFVLELPFRSPVAEAAVAA